MRNQTVKPIKDILRTLSPDANMGKNPDVRKFASLSPKLRQRVNDLLSSHSSLMAFMQVMNPTLQAACAENPERAHFGHAPTLMMLRCAYHDGAATMWMLPQLHDLGEYCGVKDKLDKGQLKQLAQILTQEFSYLKVTEVMLFLYRLKAGRYGHFYGAIDPMLIMTALRQGFMRERADAIDKHERARQQAEWEDHCRLVAQERAEARAAGRPL